MNNNEVFTKRERDNLYNAFQELRNALKLPDREIRKLQMEYTHSALIAWAKKGKKGKIEDIEYIEGIRE